MSSVFDVSHTYRGYRLQALYALFRILESKNDAALVYQPEYKEDLAIFDSDGNLLEVIQVKALSDDLVLSSFDPQKTDSFFYRTASRLKSCPLLKISIASFGKIGPEMLQACESDGVERQRLSKKLAGYGHLFEADAEGLFAKIQIIPLEEAILKKRICAALGNILTGVDPDSAFRLLSHWLYVCSENKCKISQRDVIERVNNVGKFLSERTAHHREWFTSIAPIEDREIDPQVRDELSEEFYRGVSVRYDHVLADLDVLRPQKMLEMANKFKDSRVVIVHGASGQGKTTLAYRYLNEFFPQEWRFKVELIENRKHALSIAMALIGHANAIGVPLAVYLDVSPSDRDWPELVKKLATHTNIRVLVTIREEDWRRASVSGAEIQFSSIDLDFDLTEAREVFRLLTEKKVSTKFLNFEEAWYAFGGEGPLLEFIHLITQGDSLRERLLKQVKRLQDDVREGKLESSEIELLTLVSVASAFESRLSVMPLANHLRLRVPQRTFELFEREYLLRLSPDGLIQGLHPIRSTILAHILIDPELSPWSEKASTCLGFMHSSDVETFLLHAFSRRRGDIKPLLCSIAKYQPNHWVAIVGVLRSLIWLGIAEYVEGNRAIIQKVQKDLGRGGVLFLDWDVSSVVPDDSTQPLKIFEEFIPDSKKEEIKILQSRQTDKKQVFSHAISWLSSRKQNQKPAAPMSDADWSGFAETIFWVGRLGVCWPVVEWLSDFKLDYTIDVLPIEIVADLVCGLAYGFGEGFEIWLEANRSKLITRFRQDTQTVVLEDDGRKLTAHFIVEYVQSNNTQSESEQAIDTTKDSLHDEALQRIRLLRRLFPDREIYACQGYGHILWTSIPLFDVTQKTGIKKSSLPLEWLTSVNGMFIRLAERPFRLSTWEEYALEVFELREHVLRLFKQLELALKVYFSEHKRKAVQLGGNLISITEWDCCQQMLRIPPLLPRCALDEWGIVDESTSNLIDQEIWTGLTSVSRSSLYVQKYKPFLTAFREFTSDLQRFFDQSINVMMLNQLLSKRAKSKTEKAKIKEITTQKGIKPTESTVMSLDHTIKILPKFQEGFRQLLLQFFNIGDLDALEREEQIVFNRVWSAWYFYAFQPNWVFRNATEECPRRLKLTLRKVKNNLRADLSNTFSNLEINIIPQDILWEYKSALWLAVNGKNAVDVYYSVESITAKTLQLLQKVENIELFRYVLNFFWSFIVVVPLVRGKSLDAQAWSFDLPYLLAHGNNFELNWWNFVLKLIPHSALIKLGLSKWTVPHLEVGTKLLQAVTELSLLAAHIRDFKRLPDLDDDGIKQCQNYIQSMSDHMSQVFQSVFDSMTEMLNIFNKLPAIEREHRPNLAAVIQLLKELSESILPTSDYKDRATLNFASLVEWADRLEKGREIALRVYLFWVSDVLDETIV
jgi:hypothetical protein